MKLSLLREKIEGIRLENGLSKTYVTAEPSHDLVPGTDTWAVSIQYCHWNEQQLQLGIGSEVHVWNMLIHNETTSKHLLGLSSGYAVLPYTSRLTQNQIPITGWIVGR